MNTATAIQSNETISENINIMSVDDMMRKAPRIFCTAPTNPDLSKHYTFANTQTIINDMAALGWNVVDAAQPHPRRRTGVSSFHKVTFRNGNQITRTMADGTGDVYYPEIILTNSHDGFNSFRFRISLYRVNTGKSIIINMTDADDIRIKHMGYKFEDLRALVNKAVESVPDQIAVMNNMKDHIMTVAEKRALAEAALRSRSKSTAAIPTFILDDICRPTDGYDNDDSMWSVLNTVMGKLLDGDYTATSKRGTRKARRIVSIAKTINVSQAIFRAAYEML